MENAVDPTHRQKAIDFFKHEYVIHWVDYRVPTSLVDIKV